MVTKDCRLITVSLMSWLESASVVAARDSSSIERPRAAPLSARVSAEVATKRSRAPSRFAPSGPRASVRSLTDAYSLSTSTGVAVRSIGMCAPDSMIGPPEYAGTIWMLRSGITEGVTWTALAPAGRSMPLRTWRRTSTVSPMGVTSSTDPTVTPRMRTSVPSEMPTADGNVAVMVVRPSRVTAR